MADFTMGSGSGGEKLPKARALPKGTKVRIAEMRVEQSRLYPTKPKKDGTEAPNLQLKIVVETLGAGKTLPQKGKTPTPAQPFAKGDRFVQYLGGVWQNDAGGYTFTEGGGAYAFINALAEQNIEPGDFATYAGVTFAVDHERTSGPQGSGVRIMPAEGSVEPASGGATEATDEDAEAEESTEDTEETEDANASAFEQLSEADQEAVKEALKQGPVTAAELVESGLAEDEAHAKAILASAPQPAPKKKAVKAAAKGA